MMIFMLANTIACIVASISLNIVDKKQVSVIKGEEEPCITKLLLLM